MIIAGHLNFALLRPATQISTYSYSQGGSHYNWEASNAVDGDIGTCSMTDYIDRHPWWKVQLAYPVWVTRVEIINTHTCEYIYC